MPALCRCRRRLAAADGVVSRLTRLGLVAALVILLADQASKWLILEVVFRQWPPPIEVTGFFNLVMVWNRGVSFGMLASDSDTTRWLLVALALAITAGLGYWLTRIDRLLPALSIGLVIGGAIGNVIDRLRFGAVADFFDVHVLGYHWPAFNVADSAITVGVCLLLVDGLFERKEASATR